MFELIIFEILGFLDTRFVINPLWPALKILPFEPSHEIMVLFALRKLILQTRMHSHLVGLDV